jgi:hypothetical protein
MAEAEPADRRLKIERNHLSTILVEKKFIKLTVRKWMERWIYLQVFSDEHSQDIRSSRSFR